jgi:hypothetical protein
MIANIIVPLSERGSGAEVPECGGSVRCIIVSAPDRGRRVLFNLVNGLFCFTYFQPVGRGPVLAAPPVPMIHSGFVEPKAVLPPVHSFHHVALTKITKAWYKAIAPLQTQGE